MELLRILRSRRGILAIVLFGILETASSQEKSAMEPIKLFVDYARFRGDATTLYIELYYAFSQRSLTYQQDSVGFSAGLDLVVLVYHRDSLVYADRSVMPHRAQDSAGMDEGVNLVTVSGLQLPEGDYKVTIIGGDLNDPERRDTITTTIPVRMVDTTKVVLSDLELASVIKPGATKGQFVKNTLEVIPSALGIFGETQPCFYYAEVYNLFAGNDHSNLLVRGVVRDAVGKEMITHEKQRKRVGESTVLVDQIAVNQLPTGTYILDISLVDTGHVVLSRSAKKFFVYNATLGVDTTLVTRAPHNIGNLYAGMSEEELDREFAWAKYETNDAERHQYEQLSGLQPKSTYLLDFWGRRPLGLRDEYLRRAAFANLNYHVLGRDGYKTDRGRVHIVYGAPDDVERHPNEPGSKPYEIWTYHSIQGGVIFVFVQRVEGGEYELVHSTHRNELHDELWSLHYAQTAR